MVTRMIWILASGVLAGTATAFAACPGDCNSDRQVTVDDLITAVRVSLGEVGVERCVAADSSGDGSVTIDELIAAVNAALSNCGGENETPTASPATRTLTPTATPAGEGCPLNFLDDIENAPQLCAFRGRWNPGCDAELDALLLGRRVEEQIRVGVVLTTEPPVTFAGVVTSRATASLLFYAPPPSPISGSVRLEQNGARLVLEPDEPPFSIGDCDLTRYDGSFVGLVPNPFRTAGGAMKKLGADAP